MGKGKQIYFTEKELYAVIDSCTEWYDIMNEGEETRKPAKDRMKNGLGSALRKLYSGRVGQSSYRKYKTVR